ncbi:hypothetical protein REMIM1_CH03943 [Rhizobium etli bv. mimosae str. Mim1]|nr:hypothetical protein REMIM1_CH03943 [Rhizobium etli bv. mimosae str. Mim1]
MRTAANLRMRQYILDTISSGLTGAASRFTRRQGHGAAAASADSWEELIFEPFL